jgi:hypothetical protein
MKVNKIMFIAIAILFVISNMSFIVPGASDTGEDNNDTGSISLQSAITFTNVTDQVGLAGTSGNFLAWGDYNNDGAQDLLVSGGKLFKNTGAPNYKFVDVTSNVGLTGGGSGAWADYNNDGNLDFYCAGSDILWRNQGPPGYNFKDVTVEAGYIRDEYPTTAVGWADYDLDGYVDMYITNGENYNDGSPIYYPDYMYHNNGDGTFTNVTGSSGIRNYGGPYYGRGVEWGDFDNDGWPDCYISNYRISPNFLFYNNRDGTFTDVAFDRGVMGEESRRMSTNYYGHTVGSTWVDFDNDGDLDLFESNLAHKDLYRGPICGDSQLYRNNGPDSNYDFTDIRPSSDIPEKNVGGGEDELFVGVAWGDYDNDGYQDLFIPQIYDIDYAYSYLYHNDGDSTFTNVSNDVGVLVWNTYAGCWSDYDNDGDLDLITAGKGEFSQTAPWELHLYRNDGGNSDSWLQLKLKGKKSNRAAIGARVKVTGSGMEQIREVEGGMGCHSMQNSLPLEFGFGSYTGKVQIDIKWPSGIEQNLNGVGLNQIMQITEPTIKPDLTVNEITFSNDHPIVGENVTLYAEVQNIGLEICDQADLKFIDDNNDKQIGETKIVEDLDHFEITTVSVEWDTFAAKSGDHNIYATIENSIPAESDITNNQLEANIELRKYNAVPVPRLETSPSPDEEIYVNATIYFDGSNSTDDVEVTEYYFEFGDGKSSDWVTSEVVTHIYRQEGEYTATLKVKDDDGAESALFAQVKLDVQEEPVTPPPAPPPPPPPPPPPDNNVPTISDITASPTEVKPGGSSTITVNAFDADGDPLTYDYEATGGTIAGEDDIVTWNAPDTPYAEGTTYIITVIANDGTDDSDPLSTTILVTSTPVHENNAPVINNIILDPEIVPTGGTCTITVDATDQNNDKLEYFYEYTVGFIMDDGAVVTWKAPLLEGLYKIKVTVADQYGLTDEDEINILVQEMNYAPEFVDLKVNPKTVDNDGTSEILITVEIWDGNGVSDIDRVIIDLSSIGGSTKQRLYDNSRHGDVEPDDGVFSYEMIVPVGVTSGKKNMIVTVVDLGGIEKTETLSMTINDVVSKDEDDGFLGMPGFEMASLLAGLATAVIFISYRKRKLR